MRTEQVPRQHDGIAFAKLLHLRPRLILFPFGRSLLLQMPKVIEGDHLVIRRVWHLTHILLLIQWSITAATTLIRTVIETCCTRLSDPAGGGLESRVSRTTQDVSNR